MPDNATITRLTLKVVDSDLKDVHPPKQALANIEKSSLRTQWYDLKFELRAKKLKPTSLVYMTFETVDKSTNQARYMGFAYFPLFMAEEAGGMPPLTDDVKKLSPLVGLYQMPLFAARVNESTPFTYERFVFLERVPTASVLVRVVHAPKGAGPDQEHVPAPPYKEGLYGTTYFPVTESEVQVMTLRRKRPNPRMSKVVDELLAENGIDSGDPSKI